MVKCSINVEYVDFSRQLQSTHTQTFRLLSSLGISPFLPGLPSEVETGHLGCSEVEAPNCRLLLPFSEELDGNVASYSEEAAKLGNELSSTL